MTYTKTIWSADIALTVSRLTNLASQYDLAYVDFENHNHNDLYYTKTEMDAIFWNEDNDGAGSGCDADMLYSSGGNKHASDLEGVGGTTGMIIMWESLTIPDGWHECDGTNGTKDLRDRFVLGAGSGSGLSIGELYGGTTEPTGTVTVAGHVLTWAEIMGHGHIYEDTSYGWSYAKAEAGSGSLVYANGYTYSDRYSNQCSAGVASPAAHGHEGSLFSGDDFTPLPPCKVLIYIQK
jgi:hypothetical protein